MKHAPQHPPTPLPHGVTALAKNVHRPLRRRYPRDLGPDVCATHRDGDLNIAGHPLRSYTAFYLYRPEGDLYDEPVLTLFTRVGELVVHPADLGKLYAQHGNLAIEALRAATEPSTPSSPVLEARTLAAVTAALCA